MATTQRPNIVFFFTDDQRFDTINALGNKQVSTPNIDALVAEGVAFTNGYIMGGTSGAVCMPSRAMLMTGRTLFHIEAQGQSIPDGHVLLGEALQGAGYNTFGTGKWHSGRKAYARSFSAGDEIMFGGMGDHWNVQAYHFDPSGAYGAHVPMCPNPGGSNKVVMRPCDHVTAGKHSSELFRDAAISYLTGYDSDQPFFMYISFMAPHDPRTMPDEYRNMYDPEEIELPPNFMGAHPFNNGEMKIRDEMLEDFPRTPEAVRKHIAEYYGIISHTDAQIGRVIETLKQKGVYENTIIVFAGDNGLAVGQHGLMGKQSNYEHSVHVPLIFAGPGVPKGERRDAFAYLIDIYPTLCDLIGIDPPATVEGASLVPALRNPQESPRDHLLFAYRHLHRAVRDKRLKLIECIVDGRQTTQLFDLQNDPWELTNLASDPAYAADVKRLRKLLTRWRDELDDTQEQGQTFWKSFRQ